MEGFKKFCIVDLRLSRSAALEYASCLKRFLSKYDFTREGIREFLFGVENPYTFNNWLKAFTAYARFLDIDMK